MATKQNDFKVIINYPIPDNREKFENRVARAVAKVLFETLSPQKIDELIVAYNCQMKK